MVTVALVGNPNVGKTEMFNRLTGLRQHVANWPGVTVEKKEGFFKHRGKRVDVIDLPGIYSLTAHAIDELIARNYIVEEKPDVVVDIVDSTNLERNLYLTLLLLELGANVIVALNMWDVAKARGIRINVEELSKALGVPVVPTVAKTGEGIDKLKDMIIEGIKISPKPPNYGDDIEGAISVIVERVHKDEELANKYPPRWIAIKLLEGDDEVIRRVEESEYGDEIIRLAEEFRKKFGDDLDVLLAERRYEIISSILQECVQEAMGEIKTFSDMLDHVFLHKWLGIPIFLALLYAVFQFTFAVSAPFSDAIDLAFSWAGSAAGSAIGNEKLASFIADGVFGGLGAVLVFVPPIFLLFFSLGILEYSGYLSRAAFVMDRFMYKIGLHGRSFIPMIIGFGCNIPGIMAARSIENEADRVLTVMINPLMSCSARLPVYVLLAGVIFGGGYKAGAAVFSMYVLGIALAITMALLLRRVLFGGKPSPFILELPKYMIPDLKSVVIYMWERGKLFVKKAGTVIFLVVILVWFLSTHPWAATNGGEHIENSYIATFGRMMEGVFRPLGWNWQAAVALFFGFLAKEAVVGTFGTLLGVEEGGLVDALRSAGWFTPISGLAYMAFVLIYFPCVATLGVMLREIRAKYVVVTVLYTLALAFLVACTIIGIGHILGMG